MNYEICMTEDARGAADGVHVSTYPEGRTYTVPSSTMPEHLARNFLAAGYAERVSETSEGLEHVGGGWYELPSGERIRGKEKAEKALHGPPEDKALSGPDDDKTGDA